ncbi:MAG: TadE/TadG family type IV pilus assembly protein [Hyphomicrobiales bacterium]
MPIKSAARLARRFAHVDDALAAIEFAFILPVMVIAYFGLVDAANALSASRRVAETTSIIGDLITQQTGGTIAKADLKGLFDAASQTFAPFSTAGLAIEAYGYKMNNGNPVQSWKYTNGTACPASAPAINMTNVKNLMAEGNDLVVSRVCYTVAPIVGYVFKTSIPLSDQLALRPRYSTALACSDC